MHHIKAMQWLLVEVVGVVGQVRDARVISPCSTRDPMQRMQASLDQRPPRPPLCRPSHGRMPARGSAGGCVEVDQGQQGGLQLFLVLYLRRFATDCNIHASPSAGDWRHVIVPWIWGAGDGAQAQRAGAGHSHRVAAQARFVAAQPRLSVAGSAGAQRGH
jgi:hypothetical protein